MSCGNSGPKSREMTANQYTAAAIVIFAHFSLGGIATILLIRLFAVLVGYYTFGDAAQFFTVFLGLIAALASGIYAFVVLME